MSTNPELRLAWECVEKTGSHIFLTGKAGTGKTTFLKTLKELSPKRMVVVAPTGIAAINAGGITIHSFFQLSFAPFVPETTFTPKQFKYKFAKEKISIIRSMDLLVIDEVSMVRADLLDAVDSVLRQYRDKYKPFGGVQLLMIGDLQQLSPVIKDDELNLLNRYYDTLYFFGSHALKKTDYITIELQHVYRQSDERFLGLLNRIRVNDIDDHLLAELNKRFLPGFTPKSEDRYIRLTTHNYRAQRINDNQLSSLPSPAFSFTASIQGSFPENAYPADVELCIKTGAQIMFIKNDSSAEKRYYNGKIGVVTAIGSEGIRVRGEGDPYDFQLEKEEWTNSKYTLHAETKEITEEVEGVFRQYPIRLAWAITIHKSQGLTFEHAIIDAGSSFAHGQVYVALSRCKTLEGLVLETPLTQNAVICDGAVGSFIAKAESHIDDGDKLEKMKKDYFYSLLREQFGFDSLQRPFSQIIRLLDEYLYKLYPKQLERYRNSYARFADEMEKVAEAFQKEYSPLIAGVRDYQEDAHLQRRLMAGAGYFHDKTEDILCNLLKETRVETDNKEVRKRFDEAFSTLNELVKIKKATLRHTADNGFNTSSYLKQKAYVIASLSTESKAKEKKSPKKKQVEKVEVSSDVLHPELYATLIRWRNSQAAKMGMPVYTVIQQKSIQAIVNTLPADRDDLLRIPYLGKARVEKHGNLLLEMVNAYTQKRRIERKPAP